MHVCTNLLQESHQVAERLESQAISALARLQEEAQQHTSRQAALATQLQADAATTRGQLASLKQWFDANQVNMGGMRLFAQQHLRDDRVLKILRPCFFFQAFGMLSYAIYMQEWQIIVNMFIASSTPSSQPLLGWCSI